MADGAAESPRRPSGPLDRLIRGVLWTLLAALVVGPAIAAFVFAVSVPASRIARGSAAAAASSTASEPSGSESLRRLRADEAFWKARVEFAKKEAISLAVDLVDSTATLDIRGVPVKTCKILRIEASNALKFFKTRSAFRERISKPLIIRREAATFPKEPIRVEIAPKDTTEAAKAATRPLAPEEVDAYFTLFFDGNLAIAVRQIEKPSTRSGSKQKTRMDREEKLDQAGRAVEALFRSELPQHQLRIELTLSRDDAKAIYRALGREARVALRL
jgi:hypothetical protein